MQLSTVNKNDLSMVDYFYKMKGLADTLSAIGQPMADEEVVGYMLVGLGEDYDALVTSISTRSGVITHTDLYAHILSFEMRKQHNNSAFQISESYNVMRNKGGRNGGGTRRRGRGRGNGKPTGGKTTHIAVKL